MRLFGLIGYPLEQSFSKVFFENFFMEQGLDDCVFQNFSIEDIEKLPALILDNSDLKGLAVTIPHKQRVLKFLTDKSGIPEGLNACNCIQVRDGLLYGFNTDHLGFRESLRPLLMEQHSRALVLGSGGASAAVQFALQELEIPYTLVSRHEGNNAINYAEIDEQVIKSHTLIINTTPLGMYPHIESFPDIPYSAITKEHLVYDLVYNPALTVFLTLSKEQGATVMNGLQMLRIQALENWRIWTS